MGDIVAGTTSAGKVSSSQWTRRVLHTGAALITLTSLAGAVLSVYGVKALPRMDGKLAVAGLASKVWVRRDAADVTHISAQSPQDVWRALGFVHAQDRGWQLEFNRRLMQGRLSEILGPATLELDKLMRSLDIHGAARRQYQALPPSVQEALQVYSQGVAAFYANPSQATAPEFLLLGTKPGGPGAAGGSSPWEPEDTVGWALMMALDLGGNWGNEFARLNLLQVLSTEQLWQLMPAYPGEQPVTGVDMAQLYRQLGVYRDAGAGTGAGTTSAPAQQIQSALQQWAAETVRDMGTNDGLGSNNWVVAGSKTKSGKPLLANDPHLALSAPAIWYFARLQSPGGRAADGTPLSALDVTGATLPGMPFVVLGRTAQVAWGFTNTNPDVQDLYLEQINPADASQYRTPTGWEKFGVREEVFKVKGQSDAKVMLRSTRHGPVVSDAQQQYGKVINTDKYALALRWAALDTDNRTVEAGLKANGAQTVAQLFEAFAGYHSPMQSIVAADVQGHIGFKAAGKVPVRSPAHDLRGVVPAPGWDARYDWQGWLNYAQTPQNDGSARGFVATANQRVTEPGYAHFLTQDWSLPYRYQRIEQVLAASSQHDMASMAALQSDVQSLATQALLPALRKAQSNHVLAADAQQLLASFDGQMDKARAEPLIFSVWVDELTRGIVIARIGEQRFAMTYGKRDFRAGLEGILARNDAWWCAPLSCEQQAGEALTRTLAKLQAAYGSDIKQWRWGDAHPALSAHKPFGAVAALAGIFNVSVPSGGDSYTVNVGQYNPNPLPADVKAASAKALLGGRFVSRHAPSLRAIYDLGDLESSQFIYQTGQSGMALSGRYGDMSREWADGRYRKLQMQPARWRHALELQPQKTPQL
ncbi:penicillin acylase family protein [Comamonas sp. Y33R10-2]|uniref:penicillin acylase family protein n=1 Tax=Comamonas sp. Y33R10-2 TaxID=2853257 RepID=UPI001C5CBDC7|nr:penicillin acylase family protein [Comamonas sp. Y33R10-2]QXZ10523.1 penicillin acylase family protein [Comamonas sp. Y33R10-2]